MGAALSLIPELEDVVQRGSRQKRAETLQRITALFLDGASSYSDAHVDLFDDVFGLLIEEIETKARAELSAISRRSSNAPVKVLRTLANDDDIAVAGPVLKLAPRLAGGRSRRCRQQPRARLICTRFRRGGCLARRSPTCWCGAATAKSRAASLTIAARAFPRRGFFRLVKRAEEDGILAEKVGLRPDIPPPMFRELLTRATAVVHKRLLASATPEVRAEIRRVLAKVSKEVGARVGPRDYRAAQRVVLNLHRAGQHERSGVGGILQRRQIRRDGGRRLRRSPRCRSASPTG